MNVEVYECLYVHEGLSRRITQYVRLLQLNNEFDESLNVIKKIIKQFSEDVKSTRNTEFTVNGRHIFIFILFIYIIRLM